MLLLEMAGLVDMAAGRFQDAARHLDESLSRAKVMKFPPVIEEVGLNRAALRYIQGEFQQAIGDLQAMLPVIRETPNREVEGVALTYIGASQLALGQVEPAAASLLAARAVYERLDDVAQRSWLVDTLIGRLERRRGRPDAALASYRSALGAIERVRAGTGLDGANQIGSIAMRQDAFVETADLLVDMGRPDDALDIVESFKARTLLDALALSSQRYTGVADPPARVAAGAMGPLVPADSAIVEFLLGPERSYAWVVTGERNTVVPLAGRGAIERAVEALRQTVSSPVSALNAARAAAAFDAASRGVAQLVIEPIRSALGPATRLVIVPDGALAYVPFEALVEHRNAGTGYLSDRVDISYAPSVAVLAALGSRGRSAAERSLLALGDPTYGTAPGALAPLTASRDEVTAIAALFPAETRRVLLGADAREDTLLADRLSQFRYVHLAAHGVLDEQRPARSGIALVPTPGGGDNDGVLRVDEIAALHFDADLVTLSACASGLGRVVNGEGVVGLSRAFLMAGSRSVVMSLWNVNDAATSAFMKAFYGALAQGQSRTAALREARRALQQSARRQWRHPYYWAAFTLIGQSD